MRLNYLQLLSLRRSAVMLAPDAGGGVGGADGAGEGAQGGADGANEGSGAEGGEAGGKTFTQEDIDRIIRREQAKWNRQHQKAVDDARSEGERLAKMTAEEKAAEEAKKREEDLTRREQEVTRRELRTQVLGTLSERELPAELADMVDYTDADAANESIKKLEKSFRAAVQRGVEDRVRGSAPRAGGKGGSVDGVTAAFQKLNPNLKI